MGSIARGLGAAAVVAGAVYGMPLDRLFASIAYGAAFGLFPIGWVVFSAILLYRVTVERGKFEIVKNSIANLTADERLQALLIAFAFGAFIEGAAGFGTPVAVAGAMLAGLGFSPFRAAAICLLANTAPVAFGSIAIPITTLALTTGLPVDRLSAGVGRICAPVSLFVPGISDPGDVGMERAYAPSFRRPPSAASFAGTQFAVSNFIGPQLTDILSSLAAMGSLVRSSASVRPRSRGAQSEPAPREIAGVDAVYSAGGFRLDVGRVAAATECDQYRESLADAAQYHSKDAAGRRQIRALCRGLHVRLALGLRHGLPHCRAAQRLRLLG